MAELLQWTGGALVCAGGIATIVGALGLVRLPDVYSRIHAAGIVDTAGGALMVLGMILLAPSWLVAAKLVLVGVFLFFTSPISGHAIARVAHDRGVEPVGRDETANAGKGGRP